MKTKKGLAKKIENIFPLSPLQAGILFHSLYTPETGMYFEQFLCRIQGPVDSQAVEDTWRALIDRHQILRSAFVTKNKKEPVQVVFDRLPFDVQEFDWSSHSTAEQSRRLSEYLQHDRSIDFVLNRPPLMRVTLIKLASESWQLLWSHHHILLDGWSLTLLMREFLLVYSSLRNGVQPQLRSQRPFGDYLVWLHKQDRRKMEIFWRDRLAGFMRPTSLGIDHGSAAHTSRMQQEHYRDSFTLEETRRLEQRAREHHITLNVLFQAAWGLLLNKLSGEEDVVFGVTLSGRTAPVEDIEQMVGMFINTLPLRLHITPDQKLGDWLHEVQRRNMELQEHESSGLTDIHRWTAVPGGQQLFESLFVFENFPVEVPPVNSSMGIQIVSAELIETTHLPLSIVVIPGATLSLKISYDQSRIPSESAQQLLQDLHALVLQMADSFDLPISSLEPPTASQVASLRDRCDFVATETLGDAFSKSAALYGSSIALSFGEDEWTYGRLADEANRIATYLVRRGVRAETRVGICMQRSPQQIVAMLGVILAGGTYVPIDPSYPAARISFILADSECPFLLTTSDLLTSLSDLAATQNCEVMLVEDCVSESPLPVVQPVLTPDNAAYVIYTSGSTGTPKGVLITHQNVRRLFAACGQHFQFCSSDTWTYFHSFSFDFSVWEIWGALLHGARVVIVPYLTTRDPEGFYELLVREKVTVLSQTPSAFHQLIRHEQSLLDRASLSLRYVVLGGEAIELQSLKPWFDRHPDDQPQVINMYGITETTVHVTYRRLSPEDLTKDVGSVIGQPLPDLQISLLDGYGRPVPVGAKGEICVSGAGLARGYLNRPDLTSERFVSAPLTAGAGERMYRSGDLARQLPNGDLVYCGRIDNQVKVRGHRIETGEIAAALLRHEDLNETTVRAYQNEIGETKLAAYAVCRDNDRPGVEELRNFLMQSLPDYMVPHSFILCDSFPLTIHGKLDVDALPDPSTHREEVQEEYIAPANALEWRLAEIWQSALGVPRVGRNDDFFALGGDSIRSITISSLAKDKGIGLSVGQIFAHRTISELAQALAHAQVERPAPTIEAFGLVSPSDLAYLPSDLEDAYPVGKLQAGMLFHSNFGDGLQRYHDAFSFRVQVQFDEPRWLTALDSMVADHPVLRTSFHFSDLQQPLQYVHRTASVPFAVFDLRGMHDHEQDTHIQQWLKKQLDIGFDWELPPLFRFYIHRTQDDVINVTLLVHHAILDGWSAATFFKELVERYLYALKLSDDRPGSAPIGRYREYIALEMEALASEKQREYWTSMLTNLPQLRISRWPKGRDQASSGESSGFLKRSLPAQLSRSILAFAHQTRLPLKSILLAAHFRVLQRLTGSNDVITGLVTNGRPETGDSTRVLGLFLNTVPFRLSVPGCSWLALCKTVLNAETALLPYRRYPLAQISRLNGNTVPFESSFNFVNFHIYQGLKDSKAIRLLKSTSFEQVDNPLSVNFSLDAADGNIYFGLLYDPSQFPDAQASSIAAYYERALQALVDDPFTSHTSADLLSDQERRQVLQGIDNTPHALSSPFFVHECVERRATVAPNSIAISYAGKNWSYGELNEKATCLAALIAARGGRPDTPVALMAYRSFDMVCALLAILKARCAYVPIDPDLPQNRISEIPREVNAPLFLVQDSLVSRVPETYAGETIVVNSNEEIPDLSSGNKFATQIHPLNLAYILFTSGSTGKPKGVAITHQSLTNHMQWMAETLPLTSDDIVLQKTNFMFDASVWEFWAPLMAGAKLSLAAAGSHLDSALLVQEIQNQAVTIVQLVPSMLEVVLEEPEFTACRTLRTLFVGGEALKTSLSNKFYRLLNIPLVNLYGPTEATIDSSAAIVSEFETGATANIGKPVFNSQYYVLDEELLPVPIGVPGELHIGGACLARGYWNSPDLTAECFMPSPFGDGQRLYRTRDLVRYLPDGSLECLGRIDRQFKLRGFRIEMGDIEVALMSLRGVRHCLASVQESAESGPRLVAYYQLTPDAEVGSEDIKQHLREHLPAYMVPAILHSVEPWPLLPNGKTDVRALSLLEPSARVLTVTVEPSTETELVLTEIWKKMFRVDQMGINENFFDLGGDSILSLQIVAQGRKKGLRFTSQDLFNNPTIAALALVAGKNTLQVADSFVMNGEVPLTPIQRLFFERNFPNVNHWNQAVLLEVTADYSGKHIEQALKSVVAQHDAFHLRFHREDDRWRQTYGNINSSVAFEEADSPDLGESSQREQFEAHCNRAQSSLSISDGPLIKAVYFRSDSNVRPIVLLVCHHLVIDGVSWRILLEDLNASLVQPEIGFTRSLPFGAWARRLMQAQLGERLKDEHQYWVQQTGTVSRFPVDYSTSANENTHESACSIRRDFTVDETELLLTGAPRNLNAAAAEVLLSALAETVTKWTGGDDLLISLERHGREPFLDDIDLSRSIGWFTVVYPLRLELPADRGSHNILASVKRQTRRVPNNGIGYGLLRYGSEDPSLSKALAESTTPEISFNYLGQFDSSLPSDGSFRIVTESTGDSCHPATDRDYLLEVVALVVDQRLTVQWNYSSNIHRAATIDLLAGDFSNSLKELIEEARTPDSSSWIPEDFPLATLTDAEFAEVLSPGEVFEELWPLSPVQEGMLFHTLDQENSSGVYIQQLTGELGNDWDISVLEQSWRLVLHECANLRATFVWEGLRRPLQKISSELEVPFTVFDWSSFSKSEQQDLLERFLREDRVTGFDLKRGPLMRITFIRFSDNQLQFVWTHHHILLDGWSVALLLAEVVKVYRALRAGESFSYSAPSYSSYLAWLQRQDYAAAELFWRDYLAGYDEPFLLAQIDDSKSAPSSPSDMEWCELVLSQSRTEQLLNFAHLHKITPSILIQAAWGFILSRYLQTDEIVYGVTVSGKPASLPGVEEMIGLFINTLPVRVRIHGQQLISDWLAELQASQSELLNYQYSRLVDIAGWSDIPRGQPLFDSILVFENYPIQESLQSASSQHSIENVATREQSHYPFTLYVTPGSTFKFSCSFQRSSFSHLEPNVILARLEQIICNLVEGRGSYVSDLEILSAAERKQILQTWNATEKKQENELLLPARFRETAGRFAEKIAVQCGSETITYGELEDSSNRVAYYLRMAGVSPDSTVAILLERNIHMVVALLAVLKAGAAYLALDSSFPKERLRAIVEEASPRIVLTSSKLQNILPEKAAQFVCLDDEWSAIMQLEPENFPMLAGPQNLSYLIFTSGSTGRPKGVQITHRALMNVLESFQQRPGLLSSDIFVAVTTISFDIAMLEIFLPLLVGATLVLASGDTAASGLDLMALVERSAATAMQATPVTWRMLLAAGWKPRPGFQGWCGGEMLPRELAEALVDRGVKLWNVYGPTETTIWSTVHEVQDAQRASLIGQPISNTQVYVLDNDGNLLPHGVIGELYIGGDGLTRGYLNQPALTAEKLVPDPISQRAGARLYRTGDLGRFTAYGTLECLGRADLQTKVDGFRIELGDVEAALRAISGISQAAAAVVRDQGRTNRLVAYLVYDRSQQPYESSALREMMMDLVPAYMVPSSFVVLDVLPMMPNNKLDRRALLSITGSGEFKRHVEPSTHVEEALVEIWKEAFEKGEISVDDNFFDLGGHSLIATQIHVKVTKVFQVELALRELFRSPTIQNLAAIIQRVEANPGQSEKIARVYLKIKRMSPEERSRLLPA